MNRVIILLLILSYLQPNWSLSQDFPEIDSLNTYAESLRYANPPKADSIYQIALQKSLKNDYAFGIGMACKGLGVVADVQGDRERSLINYQKSYEAFISINDSMNAYKTKFNEGMIYRQLGMYEQAKQSLTETRDVFSAYQFDIGVLMCSVNYGITLHDQGDYEGALDIFIGVKDESIKMNYMSSNVYGNIGNCYLQLGQEDSAEKYLEMAYDYAIENADYWSLPMFGVGLASLKRKNQQFDEALEILNFVKDIARANSLVESEMKTTMAISSISAQLHNYEDAYYNLSRYLHLNDSIQKNDFLMELKEKEVTIENERSKNQINLLKEKEKLSDLEKERQTMINQGLIGGVTLVLIIAVLLFLQSKKRREMNRTLQSKNEMIEEQHNEIKDSINYAQQIQTALLTSDEEWNKISPDHFVYLNPKDVVSGDFFWAFHSDQQNLSIWVAADCTGHGVPGAFMSMLGIGFLNEIIVENGHKNANEILNILRKKIMQALTQKSIDTQRKDGMDMAICVWDKKANTVEFCGANNPLYLIRKSSTQATAPFVMRESHEQFNLFELKANKMPVGAFTGELKDFKSHKFEVQKDDQIYVFSDGFPDQFGGENGKKFKYKQFRELLLKSAHLPMINQKINIEDRFEDWKGSFEQVDDICIVGIKI